MRRMPVLGLVMTVVAAWALLMPPLGAQPRPGSFVTVTTTDTTANSLLVGCTVGSTTCTGGIKAGQMSVNGVGIIGTDGRIPAISSTYFANLSGTALTGIATLAGNHNVSGTWTIDNNVSLQSRNSASAAINLATVTSGNVLILGPTDAQVGAGIGTATALTSAGLINLATNQVSRVTISSDGLLTITGAVAKTGAIAPSALANGNNNNYNPTGLSTAAYVMLTADAGGSTVTGLTAQTAGTEITLCEPTAGATSLTIAHESGSSTAANRFNLGAGGNITFNKDSSGGIAGPCATFWYHGAASRWLLRSTSGSVP